MKIEVNPDDLKKVILDFESVKSVFSEILLSVSNCDLLEISDETAIFNLRAINNVSNLLSKIEYEIVNEKSCSHEN